MKNSSPYTLLYNASSVGAGSVVDLGGEYAKAIQITHSLTALNPVGTCEYVVEWTQGDQTEGPWEVIHTSPTITAVGQASYQLDPQFLGYVRARITDAPSDGSITVKLYVE